MDLSEFNGEIVDSITKINIYGYWQMYIFDEGSEDYKEQGPVFIYYKDKFFTDVKSKPWPEEEVQTISSLGHLYNTGGTPLCIFELQKRLGTKKTEDE